MCDTSIDKLKCGRRYDNLPIVRHYYFYFAHEYTNASWKNIGRIVGRNHATAMYGVAKIKELLSVKQYTEIIETYYKIKSEIHEKIGTKYKNSKMSIIGRLELIENEMYMLEMEKTELLNK